MSEWGFFQLIIAIGFVLATIIFVTLFFIPAPYGRHARQGWGPQVPNWFGWLVMEAVSPIMVGLMFIVGEVKTITTVIFLLMWQAHYIHRAFIYPFQLRDRNKKMPIVVMGMAIVFNLGNGYTNGRYLFHFAGAGHYPAEWLLDPRFVLGTLLFASGFAINRWADRVLQHIRHPGETGYRIPQAGLYQYISCPNYFGEIVEWLGFALATWSVTGLAFAVWTIANLVPRAWSHHRWYHYTFADYPTGRKALIPGVW